MRCIELRVVLVCVLYHMAKPSIRNIIRATLEKTVIDRAWIRRCSGGRTDTLVGSSAGDAWQFALTHVLTYGNSTDGLASHQTSLNR